MQREAAVYRICVRGADRVGKSTLAVKFFTLHFVDEFAAIADTYRKEVV